MFEMLRKDCLCELVHILQVHVQEGGKISALHCWGSPRKRLCDHLDDEAVAFWTPYDDLLVLVFFQHAVSDINAGQARYELSVG